MAHVVVDASVAVKWFVPETLSDRADELLLADVELLAPRLIAKEVANTLWKKHRQKLVSRESAIDDILSLPRYFVRWLDDEAFVIDALMLSMEYDHPIYDIIYILVAKHVDTVLITADLRLVAKLSATPYARFVHSLSDWRA
jgi:hypothetical protein